MTVKPKTDNVSIVGPRVSRGGDEGMCPAHRLDRHRKRALPPVSVVLPLDAVRELVEYPTVRVYCSRRVAEFSLSPPPNFVGDRDVTMGPLTVHHVFFGTAHEHSCDSIPRLSMPRASRNHPSSPQYTPHEFRISQNLSPAAVVPYPPTSMSWSGLLYPVVSRYTPDVSVAQAKDKVRSRNVV